MAMRSTKDLKQIVTGNRAKSKMNGIAGSDYNIGGNDDDTAYATADSKQSVLDKKFGNLAKDDEKNEKDVIN
jgi:chromosome segregation ATPase